MPTQTTPRSFKENLLSFGMLVAVLLFFSFGSYFVNVLAQTPPGGNIAAPINTGDASQTKSGFLGVSGGVSLGKNGVPIFFADNSSADSLIFFSQGGRLRIREHGTQNSVITVDSGSMSLNADLNMNSAGITLGGVRRTTWPDGGSGEQISLGGDVYLQVPYARDAGRAIRCPRGYFITGVATWRNANQGDNFISFIYCSKIEGMYVPPIPPDEPVPPNQCQPDPDDPDSVICQV